MLRVVINGEKHEVDPKSTVTALLEQLGLDLQQVAVERNREIVPKSTYGQTELADGDQLEIVTFVGGG